MERKKEEEVEKELKGMAPWEQHANVISIPRFDYNAPSSLLHRSHSGFLITCSIKREKSATKEVISILGKYLGCSKSEIPECLDNPDVNGNNKRRKVSAEELNKYISSSDINKATTEDAGGLSKDGSSSPANTNQNGEAAGFDLSLVKLIRSGLLLLTFPKKNSVDTIKIVSNVFQDLESGTLKSPLWCHRIFPIQATCCLNEKELQDIVSKLVLQYVNNEDNKLTKPLKFAVAFNRRGIEETRAKTSKDVPENSDAFALLDRNKCFSTVAGVVKDAVSDSVVDLKSPELSVLVELLPISGVPSGSPIVAVSVLPRKLVNTKPKLCIRPLVLDSSGRRGGLKARLIS